MEQTNTIPREYTTAEAASLVGGLSASRVRQIAVQLLIVDVDYRMAARTMLVYESGLEKIRNRNTKPGPQPKTNGSKPK